MTDKHSLIRYTIAVPLAAFAIALLTQTGKGTLPIYTPALVLTHASPLTFGLWTTLFGTLFQLLKPLFHPHKGKIRLTAIGAIILLGLLIDVWSFLFRTLSNASFASQTFCIILACFLLAIVSFLQAELQTFILPGDALNNAIRQRFGLHLPRRFQLLDLIALLVGIVLSFIVFQKIEGVGIATIIPPFLVPYFDYVIRQGLSKLEDIDFL